MELSIQHVTKKYGKNEVIKDVTCSLNKGVIGLLGPNGAGKSTLMRMLATIEKPTSGVIKWNQIDISSSPNKLRPKLGYLPQDFGVYPNMNPVEFLEYIAAIKGLSMKVAKKRIDELLEVLNLVANKKQLLGRFSGGMRQRVGIAQALLNDPDFLIVDEPTVGLDPEERIRFRNLLSTLASDRIIILSTHIVTDIESIAPNIALLSNGKLVNFTTPEELIRQVEQKVWNCVVSSDSLQRLQKSHTVSSAIHRSDGIHARVVSDLCPTSNATLTPASLEDAYLYFVSGKEAMANE
ncbi:ABC transporter ATP-binding protein [Pseudogracilibacillus auburnensis]|uniref:ABC-type multidrug transport system ATPase subunit n=1 Tax=Pseudogracilibacillus auburnensis TaxID=1494959 RepID=A0A2V3VRS9_9BACI|nr:ABC transporter ATP-binding protein [Pseudogracilibacillus auburnensis]PXW83844.1 ABC-type multidrug transport system ATPase subunit [Pseudogracilibacillus auburnensis]